jgi:uncharacterized membrane protein
MLGEILETFYSNRKKIAGGFLGFLISYIYIRYGFFKALIVVVSTLIGYNYLDISRIVKKIVKERIKED